MHPIQDLFWKVFHMYYKLLCILYALLCGQNFILVINGCYSDPQAVDTGGTDRRAARVARPKHGISERGLGHQHVDLGL
jgi:hypothetical protein